MAGIYSLIARNRENNEAILIPIKIEDGQELYKVQIASIDKLTTYFKNEADLTMRLYNNGYIDFTSADIFIRYKYDSVYHDLEVLYQDLGKFRELTDGNKGTIDVTNETFIQGCDNYFLEFNDSKLRNYLLSSHKVNLKFKQDLQAMYESRTISDAHFYKKRIIGYLSNYRTFRDLAQTIQEFKEPKIKAIRRLKRSERQIINIKEFNRRLNVENDLSQQQNVPKEAVKEDENVLNIEIPATYGDFVSDREQTIYEDALAWQAEDKDIREQIDLDDLTTLSYNHMNELGLDNDELIKKR